jgi:hypothetical protein
LSILVGMYLFFSQRPLCLCLNCTRNKSVSGFFENMFRSYKNLMDYAIKLCREACKSSRFHFSVRLIKRRTCSKTVIMFFNIKFNENSLNLSLFVTCGRTEWKKFYRSFFAIFLWPLPHPPPQKKTIQGPRSCGRRVITVQKF